MQRDMVGEAARPGGKIELHRTSSLMSVGPYGWTSGAFLDGWGHRYREPISPLGNVRARGRPPRGSCHPCRRAPTSAVRDLPPAVDPAEPNGRAHPDIGFLAVRSGPADPVQAAAEGHVLAGGDAQVVDLVADRAAERGKPGLQALPERIRARRLQWRGEIERHDICREVGHDRVDVLGANRLRPSINKPADPGLITCSAASCCHCLIPGDAGPRPYPLSRVLEAGWQSADRQTCLRAKLADPPTSGWPASYGWRSSTLPLSGSNGAEKCSCAIFHLPFVLRQQKVARIHPERSLPSGPVPPHRLR